MRGDIPDLQTAILGAPHEQMPYDVLVVGAGVVGCAAAKAFAGYGRRVLVLERNLTKPDRIVGELLQPGGVAALENLGLEGCLQGIDASPIIGYHMFWRDDEEVSFWFCEPPLPPPSPREVRHIVPIRRGKPSGRSFHHGRFVNRLRDRIQREKNITLVKGDAIEILRDSDSTAAVGVKCRGERPTEYYADLVVLADGGRSTFRSQVSPHRPKAQSRFWALEVVGVDLPYHDYAHAVIGRGPPVLIYQISSRETRVLIDVPDDTYRRLGGNQEAMRKYLSEVVVPTLPSFLQPGLAESLHSGCRLRSMPNASVPASRTRSPGVAVLGDALNMRHALTGAGMTIGLKDAELLAKLLAPAHVPDLRDSSLVLEKLGMFHWRRKSYAAPLNILAHALHQLFVADSYGLRIMQRGFVKYIQQGEAHFAEPAAIMGGLTDSPLRLVYHFICIALYSIKLPFFEMGVSGVPLALLHSCMLVFEAIAIILPPLCDELR